MVVRVRYPDPAIPDLQYALADGPPVSKEKAVHIGEFTPAWDFGEAENFKIQGEERALGTENKFGSPIPRTKQQHAARRFCEDYQRDAKFDKPDVVSVLVHFSNGDSMFYKGPYGSWEEVPE